MTEKIKQYKNLILLAIAVILVIGIIAADPIGLLTERRHQRAIIQNEIAVEKAETEKRIAIIKAETDAELERIRGAVLTEKVTGDTDVTEEEVPVDTPTPETMEETE